MKSKKKVILVLIGLMAVCGIYYVSTYEHEWQKVDRFHVAASSGDIPALSRMLEEFDDANALGLSGDTALHVAVIAGQVEAAEFLLSHGADINIQDDRGQTPLHYAVRNVSNIRSDNHVHVAHDPQPLGLEMIKLLRNNKADLSIRDKEGRTASDWAKALGYKNLQL